MHQKVLCALQGKRFSVNDEKVLQEQISEVFFLSGLSFFREHALSKQSIVDFMTLDGCAVEVKIKGSGLSIYRQIERYCKFDCVKSMVLVTSVPIGMPEFICGKPIYVFNIAKALL